MDAIKHSDGSWRVYNGGCDVCDDSGHIAACEFPEHATLIAAAPDLLEALKGLLSWADPEPEGTRRHIRPPSHPGEIARAAIAKAEARS